MLDFFTVITKGGLVLWYFQDVAQRLESSVCAVNSLIKDVVLQERSNSLETYNHENLALKMSMDNEFQLLYVVVYQKILQLSYIDKFLSDVQQRFRDAFRTRLIQQEYFQAFDFSDEFALVLRRAEEESKIIKRVPARPRTFQESEKSKKTIGSMVEHKGWLFNTAGNDDSQAAAGKKKKKGATSIDEIQNVNNIEELQSETNTDSRDGTPERDSGNNSAAEEVVGSGDSGNDGSDASGSPPTNGGLDPFAIMRNRQMMYQGKLAVNKKRQNKAPKVPKKGKEARVWDLDNRDSSSLDYSRKISSNGGSSVLTPQQRPEYLPSTEQIGTLGGTLRNMEVQDAEPKKTGLFSMFSSLVGGKTLEVSDVAPILEKFKDSLIGKNVAAEIATKLCASVETKLIGKRVGTFEGVASVVKSVLVESLVTLLTPKRRLDILRDIKEANANKRPYTITFCGVNGVGKSTNLAKVTFWLIENNFRVLIAACDTFRAGAVEQLRTHTHHLNSLHPAEKHGGKAMVQLYEQGYGKDAADIARSAINYGRKNGFDVVMVDTAGRMQDDGPLMTALAKLILVNEPDLTLFVGEALVGNEAVDQLVKFNRTLANYSPASSNNTQMIDGILLTKFDTIDDKVGAAISMTYITGQPIVFVGTGQTYADLRNIDAKAVVHMLMK